MIHCHGLCIGQIYFHQRPWNCNRRQCCSLCLHCWLTFQSFDRRIARGSVTKNASFGILSWPLFSIVKFLMSLMHTRGKNLTVMLIFCPVNETVCSFIGCGACGAEQISFPSFVVFFIQMKSLISSAMTSCTKYECDVRLHKFTSRQTKSSKTTSLKEANHVFRQWKGTLKVGTYCSWLHCQAERL